MVNHTIRHNQKTKKRPNIFFSEARGWFFYPMLSCKAFERVWNKFIEINFCVGCMVWQWFRLLQDWTFVKYWWDEHVLLWMIYIITHRGPSFHLASSKLKIRISSRNSVSLVTPPRTAASQSLICTAQWPSQWGQNFSEVTFEILFS